MTTFEFFKQIAWPSHQKTLSLFGKLLTQNAGWLGALWLVSFLLPQALSELGAQSPVSGPNVPVILAIATVDMTISLLLYLFLPARAKTAMQDEAPLPLSQIFTGHFKDLLAEQLRVAASVIVGFILLIIPGLIRLVQYIFVPILVVVDTSYYAGEIDALEHSKKLTKGLFWPLALIFGALLAVDFGLYLVELAPSGKLTPLWVWAWQSGLSLISLVVRVYGVLLTTQIYFTLNLRSSS